MKRVVVLMTFLVGVGTVASVCAEQHLGTTFTANGSIPLFTQCPPVGLDSGCATLITITAAGGVTTDTDPNQGAYDGEEDQLIGIQNNFRAPICSITLNSSARLFGFDEDGLCDVSPHPSGCPFGSTGYEGPGTSFAVVDDFNGTVMFTPCIPPGGSAYFSLEEDALGEVSFPAFTTGGVAAPALGPFALLALATGLAGTGAARAARRRGVGPRG